MNVLITGASRGLGKALMERFVREGHQVVGVARGEEALRRAADGAVPLVADVGQDGERIVAEAQGLIGELDLVVLAASTLGPTPLRALSDTRAEELEQVLRVNLLGSFRIARAALAGMRVRGRGTVVFVSSDAAVEAYPTWGAYSVSKAAQDHLMRIWAAELQGTGVRLVSVDPGEMDTVMHAAAIPEADPSALRRPEDSAARLVAFLDEARTGERGVL